LEKAEIAARAWRGQSTGELAAMFKVTRRTINKVVREARDEQKRNAAPSP
jgi:DNA-directed RNA polymerase specialized sigma24 family protein